MAHKTDADLAECIAAGWVYDGVKIHRIFAFANFGDAFAFMARCVPEIEKLDHHPEWSNTYNKVTVALTTHDADGVTAKDCELARIMERLFAALPRR